MLGHLGAILGHLRAMLGDRVRCLSLRKNMLNGTGPKNTVNYRGICRHAHPEVGGRGGQRI